MWSLCLLLLGDSPPLETANEYSMTQHQRTKPAVAKQQFPDSMMGRHGNMCMLSGKLLKNISTT